MRAQATPFALLLMAFVFAGCETDPLWTCQVEKRAGIVFVDRSASARIDSVAQADFREAVLDLADHVLICQEDQLYGYTLFANTGIAFSAKYRMVAARAEELSEVSEIDRPAIIDAFETEQKVERLTAVTHLQKKLDTGSAIPKSATLETDILGSLRIIQETFEDLPDSSYKEVLYLSDMHESKKGHGRRDFDKRPPRDLHEAVSWAAADVQRLIDQKEVTADALDGVVVRVLRSTLGLGTHSDNIRAYWKTVFETLGAARIEMN